MVTTATNHRPTTQTAPSTNNRMAKADKIAKKSPKKSEKPHGILESSPELRNAVAAIEKQFGEGSIMPLGATEGATGAPGLRLAMTMGRSRP